MSKKAKEEIKEKLDHMTVSKSDYEANKSSINYMADTVTIDDDPDGDGKINDGVIKEILKIKGVDALRGLGLNVAANIQAAVIEDVKVMLSQIAKKYNIAIPILSEDEDKTGLEDADLFGDEEKAEREMNFESVMKDLSEKNGPVVEVTEGINPRIKKSDLIEYFNKQTK